LKSTALRELFSCFRLNMKTGKSVDTKCDCRMWLQMIESDHEI
jgi:hypothetical protein